MEKQTGFTIVELLIVIVVVGIMAAITLVSYQGIQQRSNNAARIQAAKQTLNLARMYRIETGNFHATGATCGTVDNQCSNYAGSTITTDNTTPLQRLRTVGEPTKSIPRQSGNYYGITFDVYAPRSVDGDDSRDMLMMYWLEGENQDCQLKIVRDSGGNQFLTSAEKNTGSSSSSRRTTCWVGV